VMERRTVGECLEVTDHLGKMFSLLQTLPDSMKGSARIPGKAWRAEEDRIVLVTNPKFYKIEGISMEKEQCKKRKKASQVVKTNNMLHMDLMWHAGYDDILMSRNLRWLQARSGVGAHASPFQERGGGTPCVGPPLSASGALGPMASQHRFCQLRTLPQGV